MVAPSIPARELPYDGPPPERILERQTPIPDRRLSSMAWPAGGPQIETIAAMMGEDFVRLFLFNKNHPDERICPHCRNRYRIAPQAQTRAEQEQELSGICSSNCFVQLQGPDGYDVDEWLGTQSDSVTISQDADGNLVSSHVIDRGNGPGVEDHTIYKRPPTQ